MGSSVKDMVSCLVALSHSIGDIERAVEEFDANGGGEVVSPEVHYRLDRLRQVLGEIETAYSHECMVDAARVDGLVARENRIKNFLSSLRETA